MYGPIARIVFEKGKKYKIGSGIIMQSLDFTYEEEEFVGSLEVCNRKEGGCRETVTHFIFKNSEQFISYSVATRNWEDRIDIVLYPFHNAKSVNALIEEYGKVDIKLFQ